MKRLSKTDQFNVRVSPEQRARVARAAKLVSIEKGEVIDAGSLFRDCAMEGIDAILNRASDDRRSGADRRQEVAA